MFVFSQQYENYMRAGNFCIFVVFYCYIPSTYKNAWHIVVSNKYLSNG